MIGGRGATTGTPTTAIVAVDVARKQVRDAGHLKTARSDLAAATLGAHIIVVGGHRPPPAPSRPSRDSRRLHGH